MLIKENGEMFQEKNRPGKSDCMMYVMLNVMLIVFLIVAPQALRAEGTREMEVLSYIGILFSGEIILLAYTIASYDKYWLKYEICEDGLWIKFPLDKEKLIPWDEFQEVCVCYDRWGSLRTGRLYYVVICFVKHGVRKGVNNRWYIGIFNYRNIISMDYTYELYDELRQKCPLGVLDLRDTPEYEIK